MNKQESHNLNLQSDILVDLPLADEQADETRGGTGKTMAAEVLARNSGSTTDIYILQDFTNSAQNSF